MSDDEKNVERSVIPIPGDEHFDLKGWPFYWLIKAYGGYVSKMEECLKDVELDLPRWRVLMLLEGDRARSVSYLAKEAISKLSTMTRIVQRMQEDGLVVTRPRATDQRVTEVLLTGNGRRARVLALQQAEHIYNTAFQSMDEDSIETLNRMLSQLQRNLSK